MTSCCDGNYCHARKRGDTGYCHRPPGWGTEHAGLGRCKLHGGSTANHVKAAHMEQAQRTADEALKLLGRDGVQPVTNPLEALADLAGEIVAVKDIFRERVTRLREEQWRFADDKGGEQLRAEVALYERALDRAARVLGEIARLKIDDRLAAITEAQAGTVAAVIAAVLERLELGDRTGQVRDLVAAELERVAA
jgi:hypothetical protein